MGKHQFISTKKIDKVGVELMSIRSKRDIKYSRDVVNKHLNSRGRYEIQFAFQK